MSPAEHYRQVQSVYRELGRIEDWHAIGNADFVGWYRTRNGPGEWDGEGRPWALAADWPELRRSVDRVIYATINYAPREWFMDAWRPFKYGESGRRWDGDSTPTPGYGDLRAYAPFADIDLTDDVKKARPDGDIPRDAIEDALTLYIDTFAHLAGGREHVFALDSVGGAYVMVAPTATTPIAEAFDGPDRARLFDDLTDRMNEWLDDVRADVNGSIPAVEETFEPDLLNNKNRLYKAPMSVHSSLEGVVTPVDPDAPAYEFTHLEAVDSQHIADAEAWAAGFTADHREAIESVVAGLWPDYAAAADGWEAALSDRLDDLKASEERQRELRESRTADVPDDLEATADIDQVNAAIEAIDVDRVAEEVAETTDRGGDQPIRFNPPWRNSDSGTSCFADANKFYDLDGGDGGGALKLIAKATAGIDPDLKGEDYWKAVNELRKVGFDIPYFTGRNGTHPDGLRLFEASDEEDDDMRKVLRAVAASGRD